MGTDWVVVGLLLGGSALSATAFWLGLASRSSPERNRTVRSAALAMIVGAVVAGAAAAVAVFDVRSADERVPAVAVVVLVGAALFFLSGYALHRGARGTHDAHVVGRAGRGVIRSRRPTDQTVDGRPVWELDLDVSAPGIETFRTQVLDVIRPEGAEGARDGAYVALTIFESPSRKVVIDWHKTLGTGDEAGAFAEYPRPGDVDGD